MRCGGRCTRWVALAASSHATAICDKDWLQVYSLATQVCSHSSAMTHSGWLQVPCRSRWLERQTTYTPCSLSVFAPCWVRSLLARGQSFALPIHRCRSRCSGIYDRVLSWCAVPCCAMSPQELSDIRELTSCLADDSAIELWGKVGTAHLASLLTAAAHM